MTPPLDVWALPVGGKTRAPGGAGPRGCRPTAGARDGPRPTRAVHARRGEKRGGLGCCCCRVGPERVPTQMKKNLFLFIQKGFKPKFSPYL